VLFRGKDAHAGETDGPARLVVVARDTGTLYAAAQKRARLGAVFAHSCPSPTGPRLSATEIA
jgi:hypothetical protein